VHLQHLPAVVLYRQQLLQAGVDIPALLQSPMHAIAWVGPCFCSVLHVLAQLESFSRA